MDPSGHHPEPFGEAASYSSQRVTQLVSLVAAAAEVRMRAHSGTHRAPREARPAGTAPAGRPRTRRPRERQGRVGARPRC